MISVVVPVRNAVNTLERSLRSVLDQDMVDLEVICIFNGCTDGSEDVVKKIDDSRIKVRHSSPGIVPALNEGLRSALGDLIARQDADDVWKPGKLKAQHQYLMQHPEVDVIGTQLTVVDGTGKFLYNTKYPTEHSEICAELLAGVNSLGHPSVLFKRKILDKCAGYFDLFPLAEDLDLWTRAMAWHRFSNLDESFVIYRHVPNQKYDPHVPKTLASWYRMIYGVK